MGTEKLSEKRHAGNYVGRRPCEGVKFLERDSAPFADRQAILTANALEACCAEAVDRRQAPRGAPFVWLFVSVSIAVPQSRPVLGQVVDSRAGFNQHAIGKQNVRPG